MASVESSPYSIAPGGEAIGEPVSPARPISRAARITALDCIRGFAVLGILLMNIVGMGVYGGAYIDPTIIGGDKGANLWMWVTMHIIADGKMRCLFSMIFGSSVVLLTSRLEGRQDAADIYYRRTLWLLVFGIVHAYLLWYGDILYAYALCGLLLYPFRNLRAKKLVIIGAVLVLLDSAMYVGTAFELRDTIRRGTAAEQIEAGGTKLSDEQQTAKAQYERWRKIMRPTAEELAHDADQWRGNPLKVIAIRASVVFNLFHNAPYYSPDNFDIWSMMFLGMGLIKLDVLSGKRSRRFYLSLLVVGYGVGVPVNVYTAWMIVRNHFDPVAYGLSNAFLDPGRFLVAAGHLSVVMLVLKAGWFKPLMRGLGAAGQLALSNYILQSVITAFLFTGYGFRFYDRMQRFQLYYIVAGIWVIGLVWSSIWLRHFQFGPLEWCWRSLTYWKRQPMRLRTPDVISQAAAQPLLTGTDGPC
ncbi:MAG: DUF418 domain-containing protein [Acidobacteriaceae bacterium]|nr:DUF418 domain-containing protein [Acidobacteriaceae bacterium]